MQKVELCWVMVVVAGQDARVSFRDVQCLHIDFAKTKVSFFDSSLVTCVLVRKPTSQKSSANTIPRLHASYFAHGSIAAAQPSSETPSISTCPVNKIRGEITFGARRHAVPVVESNNDP